MTGDSHEPTGRAVDEQSAAIPPPREETPKHNDGWASRNRRALADSILETLHAVRHELALIGYASKFDWINKRLIVLRNAVIAIGVITTIFVVFTLCYRQAYRQTLNISAFDVPERLSERGITGQVVAKALFDELVRRRKTVTTLDPGELKEAWTEHGSDVAIPQTQFSAQSLFAFLRHLTGNEIGVDGELLVENDLVTIRARVVGHPPLSVVGKLSEWEALMGELANYVYEITQPAVLASYMGLSAHTTEDLSALSKQIVRMVDFTPRLPSNVMAVAYDAYGGALMRQDKLPEALEAFNQAIHYDPNLGLAVMNAAEVNFRLGNGREAQRLYVKAAKMQITDSVKREALRRRVSLALNSLNCVEAGTAISEAKKLAKYSDFWERWMDARFLVSCAFEEERATDIVRRIATLHPDAANAWLYLSAVLIERPGSKHLREAEYASRQAIKNSTNRWDILNYFAHVNLIIALATLGDTDQAQKIYLDAKVIIPAERAEHPWLRALILFYKGEYSAAETELRPRFVAPSKAGADDHRLLGMTLEKLGRTEEALAVLRTGQKKFPKVCALYDAAGNLLVRAHRVREALTEFDRGIAAVSKCGLPYISAARALIATKRNSEAHSKLAMLIKVAPTSDGAHEAVDIQATLNDSAPRMARQ